MSDKELSIAIETSSRQGSVAVGLGDNMLSDLCFDASSRHAAQLISHLDGMLSKSGYSPGDIDHVYVSVGPGSFTGLRIGVTVARTLGQMIDGLKCVAVPAAQVVARNALNLEWQNLGVVLASKNNQAWTALFKRDEQSISQASPGELSDFGQFLESAPRPLTLIGEALQYLDIPEDITAVDHELSAPKANHVWSIGRKLAAAGQFAEYHHLLPAYARQPEALRLWEEKLKTEGKQPRR